MTRVTKWTNSALALVMAMQLASCSTSRVNVNYETFDKDFKLKADAFDGKSMGAVKGEEGGAIWDSCEKKAPASLRDMIEKAKGSGANAIGDIRWTATGTSTPSCKKGWGYLVIWPFILTPLFMSTEVTGDMYKIEGGGSKKHAGLIMLPKTAAEEDALIKRLTQNL